MQRSPEQPSPVEKAFVIDSLPKLVQYLGAVALEMPGAMFKILSGERPRI